MPSHTFSYWQERTGTYGDKHYFSNFQPLGYQSGKEISCTVSLYITGMAEAQVFSPFYVLFEHFCHITHNIFLPTKTRLGVNHAFALGANELNFLTVSMHW